MKQINKREKKSLLVRVPSHLYYKMRHLSIDIGKSLNQYVVDFFKEQVDVYTKETEKQLLQTQTDKDIPLEKDNILFEDIDLSNIPLVFKTFNDLNKDRSAFKSADDECTPMECVKTMIDYIPNELWDRPSLRILDPCSGNGNFGAYAMTKTSINNIWFNEINVERHNKCISILNPLHIRCGDGLALDGEFEGKYDLVMANPPYSGGGNKNQSLSNLFIEKSIDLLNMNGYLCFITPNNWMTYNNKNTTLDKLFTNGSFIVIDNDAKKHFPKVGSSFTIFICQKGKHDNKTKVFNNYLIKDVQDNIEFSPLLKFIPLYISKETLSLSLKLISESRNVFDYRCDLHNFTQKDQLSDEQDDVFLYETIHTARKTRFAKFKQDIFNKWTIIVPLSTYYVPYIKTKINVTQSVGYISFDSEQEAKKYLQIITKDEIKLLIHLTRYGNFNNIKVLRHLKFEGNYTLTNEENTVVQKLVKQIKY